MSCITQAFWLVLTERNINWNSLVLTYDLLKDNRLDDVAITKSSASLLYKTSRFYVAAGLHSRRSQQIFKMWKEHQWHIFLVLLCHYFVLNSFWRHLWSITEQTLGNVESTYQFSWNLLWWWDEWILSYKGSNLSEVTPPPPSFPGATPLVGGRCQPCVDRGSITQQKAPITLTARRKLVLVMFNWMQRIIEVFYSRIVYSTSR